MSNVLFLFAHNDDEYFAALRMREELRLGNRVLVAYLTHGSIYGTDARTRMRESRQVLSKLGINENDILAIGQEQNIFDCQLHAKSMDAYQALCASVEKVPLQRFYVLAWEGGHPDHDASHLIGMAFARRRNLLDVYEFPAYSRYRVMHPPNNAAGILRTRTDHVAAFQAFVSGFSYHSQRKTFLAMLPGSIGQLLLLGYQTYWPVPKQRDYSQPPHAGRLFYTRRYKISFEQFIEGMQALHQYL